jgi:hypothetical protein
VRVDIRIGPQIPLSPPLGRRQCDEVLADRFDDVLAKEGSSILVLAGDPQVTIGRPKQHALNTYSEPIGSLTRC